MSVAIAARVELNALPGLPIVEPGDDLVACIRRGLHAAAIELADCDVLVVASKLISRSNNRFVDLAQVTAGAEAQELAQRVDKDPRLVELILGESVAVSRAVPGVLIVRHRLGYVSANAGMDSSNATPGHAQPGSGPWVLLLPEDPDAAARDLRRRLEASMGVRLGVIVSDSFGRPFRRGTVGTALGVAGLPALNDMRGSRDLGGRELQYTQTALADQLAAAADLVAGQADEARGVIHVRGVRWDPSDHQGQPSDGPTGARALLRPMDQDLYA